MKILYASDLHLEFKQQEQLPELPEFDVMVLAGDISSGINSVLFAKHIANDKPVILVPGNHEYYGRDMRELDADLSAKVNSEGFENVHLLNPGFIDIDGVRFIGGTLWTDFHLEGYVDYSFYDYSRAISDFNVIRFGERVFSPQDSYNRFISEKVFIDSKLRETTENKKVVVTHFLPSQECIIPFYQGNNLNPYFCNDLDSVINEHSPELWIYGHTHSKLDKVHSNGKTRLLCNPRGYPKERKDYFKWKVVEI